MIEVTNNVLPRHNYPVHNCLDQGCRRDYLTGWDKCPKLSSCIIPADKWDGKTGIPEMLKKGCMDQPPMKISKADKKALQQAIEAALTE